MTEAQIDQLIFAGSVLGAAAVLVGIGVWVGGVNEFKKGVTKLLDEIRQDIKDLRQDIQRLFRSTVGTTEAGSPRRLTELGETVAAALALEPVGPKPSLAQVSPTSGPLQEDFRNHRGSALDPKQLQWCPSPITPPWGDRGTEGAAQARALGATLVTRNDREFQRVPGPEIEGW